MRLNDFTGRAVLITGGTQGIGLATARAFAREGARCVLTYRWGSVEEDELRALFRADGLAEPLLVQADVANEEDTSALLERIRADHERVEVLVSNVSFALVTKSLQDYSKRALSQSINYSAWPFFEYTRRIREVFGAYPRYVIGLSSGGPDCYYQGYDFVAASKAVMETLCRYLGYHLFDEDVRLNIVRSRLLRTESLWATFGAEFEEFSKRMAMEEEYLDTSEIADAVLALASGLMDGVNGQVITVDRGTMFADTLMHYFDKRERIEIGPENGEY